MDGHSVTLWLSQLKQGDQSAAKKLWDRYGPTLVRLARQSYRSCTGPEFDEEDLVQSVFTSLWQRATAGGLENVNKRDDLWWLLLAITRRKALSRANYYSRQKRGGGMKSVPLQKQLADDLSFNSTPILDPNQPPPDLILVLEEERQTLLGLLRDDTLRQIASWKFEGYSLDEIAKRLTVTPRTVLRKMNLIRERWSKELHS